MTIRAVPPLPPPRIFAAYPSSPVALPELTALSAHPGVSRWLPAKLRRASVCTSAANRYVSCTFFALSFSPLSLLPSASALDLDHFADGPPVPLDDYLVETDRATFDRKAPAVTQQLLAADLKSMNLSTTAAALRNLPNLFIRERFIGDKNAPIGIRGTSNRQTGRTLVLGDGILLSNFLGTGFGNSPRWFLIAPEEIEKIAVIYGPFSAMYAGNSLGGTVLFTTKMPTQFIAAAKGQFFAHSFHEYGTNDDLHGTNGSISIGDKVGNFSYYAFYNHLNNQSASTQFWTVNDSATSSPNSGGVPVTGAFHDTDFSGQPRAIYGAEGPTEAIHDLFKVKASYQPLPALEIRYTFAYWINQENRLDPETYLRDLNGTEVWSGKVSSAERAYTISPAQFGLSKRSQADLVNAATVVYQPETGLQALIGSFYNVLKDKQNTSTDPLPTARVAGAGQATLLGSTGWESIDLKLGYRTSEGLLSAHAPSLGYHSDHYFNISNQYALSNWRDLSTRTSLISGNGGATQTQAVYAQNVWSLSPAWSLTPGVRWEK